MNNKKTVSDKPNYYAIIPANVRYDKNVTPNAKLLYAEITALCNKYGYCYATNQYFQNLYGVSKQSISNWLSQLEKNHYIKRELIYREGSKEILQRHIKLFVNPRRNNLERPTQNYLKENNTRKNITMNNTLPKEKKDRRLK